MVKWHPLGAFLAVLYKNVKTLDTEIVFYDSGLSQVKIMISEVNLSENINEIEDIDSFQSLTAMKLIGEKRKIEHMEFISNDTKYLLIIFEKGPLMFLRLHSAPPQSHQHTSGGPFIIGNGIISGSVDQQYNSPLYFVKLHLVNHQPQNCQAILSFLDDITGNAMAIIGTRQNQQRQQQQQQRQLLVQTSNIGYNNTGASSGNSSLNNSTGSNIINGSGTSLTNRGAGNVNNSGNNISASMTIVMSSSNSVSNSAYSSHSNGSNSTLNSCFSLLFNYLLKNLSFQNLDLVENLLSFMESSASNDPNDPSASTSSSFIGGQSGHSKRLYLMNYHRRFFIQLLKMNHYEKAFRLALTLQNTDMFEDLYAYLLRKKKYFLSYLAFTKSSKTFQMKLENYSTFDELKEHLKPPSSSSNSDLVKMKKSSIDEAEYDTGRQEQQNLFLLDELLEKLQSGNTKNFTKEELNILGAHFETEGELTLAILCYQMQSKDNENSKRIESLKSSTKFIDPFSQLR